MKSVYLFLILFIIPFSEHYAQDNSLPSTSIQSWEALMNKCQLSVDQLITECPGFPNPESFQNDASFTSAVHKWYKSKKAEVDHFWSLPQIVQGNPSAYYLGLPVQERFEHSTWDLYSASGMSQERIDEVAPHFPVPEISGDFGKDKEKYDQQLYRWYALYGHEYEAFYNCTEIISLNPHYDGDQDLVAFPKFMGALTSNDKPGFVNTGNPFDDGVRHELRIQNWYFVFHADEFEEKYGFYPSFPQGFSEDAYRQKIIDKIETNKIANPEDDDYR